MKTLSFWKVVTYLFHSHTLYLIYLEFEINLLGLTHNRERVPFFFLAQVLTLAIIFYHVSMYRTGTYRCIHIEGGAR